MHHGRPRETAHPPQGVFGTFPKNEKKLIDICDTLGVPNHHLDTKPNAASPRHHLAVSQPSISPPPDHNHHRIYHQFEYTKDELDDKGMAHNDTYD